MILSQDDEQRVAYAHLVGALLSQYGESRANLLSHFSGLIAIFLLQTSERQTSAEERGRLTEMAAVVAGQLCKALTKTPPEAESMALHVRDLVNHLMLYAAHEPTGKVH